MTPMLRIALVVFSLLILVIVLKRIKKTSLEIADSIFWLFLALILLVIAVFPQIAYWVSSLLGFDAPSNFVFFCGFIVLMIRTFTQDQKITTLKKKLTSLAQHEALSGK